jgi:hypothetical protein
MLPERLKPFLFHRAIHGEKMARKWRENGEKMARKWRENGEKMARWQERKGGRKKEREKETVPFSTDP